MPLWSAALNATLQERPYCDSESGRRHLAAHVMYEAGYSWPRWNGMWGGQEDAWTQFATDNRHSTRWISQLGTWHSASSHAAGRAGRMLFRCIPTESAARGILCASGGVLVVNEPGESGLRPIVRCRA